MQLMNSRYTDSRAAYREVQERHEDIKRIEKTLGELAQLFNDVCSSFLLFLGVMCLNSPLQMSILVEQQNEVVDNIYTQAEGVQRDTEAG